jgi:hypothetical protein
MLTQCLLTFQDQKYENKNIYKGIRQKDIQEHKQYLQVSKLFKEYLKLLNNLYDITWFGLVYA